MAFRDIWEMFGEQNGYIGVRKAIQTGNNDSESRDFGMEHGSDWTKHRVSSAFTAQVIRSATSLMPWTCKIPIEKRRESQNPICVSLPRLCKIRLFIQKAIPINLLRPPIPLLPGLPDDVAKYCLALVPRSSFPSVGGVCKRWRSFIQSKEYLTERKIAGMLEEWLYVLTMDSEGKESHWEVFDCLGQKHRLLPPMPGPTKVGFGIAVLNGKLLVLAGYSVVNGTASASADVYRYDSCLNSWRKLADLNVARYDFACAEVNGVVYVVGGYGNEGESLSTAEVYDPDTDMWTLIESLRRPRWGCFACGLNGKLYVLGGRSSFTIGNSRFVDVYNPEKHTWGQMKNGCVMVTAHAVLEKKLFCMEWKNQRKLAIFNPDDHSWKMVPVPLTGSTRIGFRFGILDRKLLLFSVEGDPGFRTLMYDPNSVPGLEWQISDIKPSGSCLCSVTIKA